MRLKYFTRRRGHDEFCEIEKTSDGWIINALGLTGGECSSDGKPHLFKILDHDGVNYPEALGGYVDWLWRQAYEKNMSVDEIQENLDMLGEWITQVEKSSPGGLFKLYK